MVFGVLEVATKEIVWQEMPFGGQIVVDMDALNVEALIAKLKNKTTIGNLLAIKAQAQNIEIVETENADETYTIQSAMSTAAVTKLLID
ncbi:MAG: hypothetical protein QM660_13395 [Dysgonomonas sp.]